MRDAISPVYKTSMYLHGAKPPAGFAGEPERRQISAGNFEETPKGMRFAASPEALETIRRVKERTGLDLQVFPMSDPNAPPGALGYLCTMKKKEGVTIL